MRINDIFEAQQKTAVVAFGRMNPPTIGHRKLVDAMLAQAGDPFLFLSHTQKPATDPLSFEEKAGFAKAFFPEVTVGNTQVRTFFDAIKYVNSLGYNRLIYVAGSDRVEQFTKLAIQYNGHDDMYEFDDIHVVSAGQRDPDADGAEGMSASKMRAAASAGDLASFTQGVPNPDVAQAMYDKVRSGMNILERVSSVLETLRRLNQIRTIDPSVTRHIVEQIDYIKQEFGSKRQSLNEYAKGFTRSEMEREITKSAKKHGIDPSVALKVWRSEGGMHYQSNIKRDGKGSAGGREASYGPFQLYTGGGLGNEWEKKYGKKLSQSNDPDSIKQQIDFAMKKASHVGWKPWYGAAKAGINRYDGINNQQTQVASAGSVPKQEPTIYDPPTKKPDWYNPKPTGSTDDNIRYADASDHINFATDAPAFVPPNPTSFGDVFKAARKKHGGPGGEFTYNGKKYQTNVKGEEYATNPVNVDEAKLDLPDLETGDELMVGKFKNRKATIKDFTKDKNNQPIAVTDKGDQQIFKGRVKKLMPTEEGITWIKEIVNTESRVKKVMLTNEADTLNLPNMLDDTVVTLGKLFAKNGYEIRIVGGAVRDVALGKTPKDIDLATDATPTEMQAMFDSAGIRHIPTGIEHGTITAVIDNEPYEITTLRADKTTDGRHAEVEFVRSWEEDAKRRDLTYNAMSLDMEGNVHDYFGGMDDLQNKVSKFVGDPEARIQEDYLRILRYFRFQAKLDTPTFDKEIIDVIAKNAKGLTQVSAERIWQEVSKLLVSPSMAVAVSWLGKTGVAKYIGLDITGTPKQFDNPIIALANITSDASLGSKWRLSNNDNALLTFLIENKVTKIDQTRAENFVADGIPDVYIQALATLQNVNLKTISVPDFPVTGKDLIALGIKSGPNMGTHLAQLKQIWQQSRFKASKEDLLKNLADVVEGKSTHKKEKGSTMRIKDIINEVDKIPPNTNIPGAQGAGPGRGYPDRTGRVVQPQSFSGKVAAGDSTQSVYKQELALQKKQNLLNKGKIHVPAVPASKIPRSKAANDAIGASPSELRDMGGHRGQTIKRNPRTPGMDNVNKALKNVDINKLDPSQKKKLIAKVNDLLKSGSKAAKKYGKYGKLLGVIGMATSAGLEMLDPSIAQAANEAKQSILGNKVQLNEVQYILVDVQGSTVTLGNPEDPRQTTQLSLADKSVQSGMIKVTEAGSPHKKGTKKYKKHMAAMHAGMKEDVPNENT